MVASLRCDVASVRPHLIQEDDGRVGHELHADRQHLALPRGQAVGGACLADDMLRLTLTCVAASAGERAPVTKQLPRTTTVATLKQLCDRLFRVPATSMALYVRRAGAPVPEALTEEQRDLYWLGVNSGDGILIDTIKDGQR